MHSDTPEASIRFLLDEHYPAWLAAELRATGVDAVAIAGDRVELIGRPDEDVLSRAAQELRVVVTEDVSTFPAAMAQVPDHHGVIYCHHRRFPRTRAGLAKLAAALVSIAAQPPEGLGRGPMVWWLSE